MTGIRPIRGEAGMTLIEVMVGLFIAALSVIATVSLLSTGTKDSLGHQRDVQMLSIAQRELETVTTTARRFGFDGVALNAAPAASAVPATGNPIDPNAFVSGGNLAIQADYANASTALRAEPLIVGGTTAYPAAGRIAQFTPSVQSGNLTANVFRYVTDDTTAGCPSGATCAGDVRRVTVAVVPVTDDQLQHTKPVWLSTTLSSPNPNGSASGGSGSISLSVGLNVP